MANNPEMTVSPAQAPASLMEAAACLAENLAQSEPLLRYRAAEAQLHGDSQAMQLLSDLSALQQSIRQQQYAGALPQSDLVRLRALQSAVTVNESIQDYVLAQDAAIAFIREINQEISQLLGVDFASLARRSGGCC